VRTERTTATETMTGHIRTQMNPNLAFGLEDSTIRSRVARRSQGNAARASAASRQDSRIIGGPCWGVRTPAATQL
jgi:hypothetical protein